MCLGTRFIDLFRQEPADNRSGDEVARDVMERLGLKYECI
jgi:hypothetical protein|nr:MAG TPA: hypothetical protein [Caudoviricetes sp.]